MAGKNLFAAFPEAKDALTRGYIETRGSMPEAAGVRGRPDAQWVAVSPVKADSRTVALYATGWSWSAYAYRLETALRSSELSELKQGDKMPLLYVYVLVDQAAYGAPVSPEVNAKAIAERDR